jgi:hypothetical protein
MTTIQFCQRAAAPDHAEQRRLTAARILVAIGHGNTDEMIDAILDGIGLRLGGAPIDNGVSQKIAAELFGIDDDDEEEEGAEEDDEDDEDDDDEDDDEKDDDEEDDDGEHDEPKEPVTDVPPGVG